MADLSEAETAVREYLAWLDAGRPKVKDAAAQQREKELVAAVAASTDPIERLKLYSQLEALEDAPATNPLEEAFVAHAKVWADANAISAATFRKLDNPPDSAVLRRAGFRVGRGRAEGGARRRREGGPRSSAADVKGAVIRMPKRFTLAELQAAAGGSPATVRSAVKELVDEGRVVDLGADPNHRRQGRAPTLYEQR